MRAVSSMRGAAGTMTLQLTFEDFLHSGCMRSRAVSAMCDPEDLIYDHLPAFDCGEPDEIREAFAEACEQGSDHAVSKVELDDRDLEYVRTRFLRERRFRYVPGAMPPAA